MENKINSGCEYNRPRRPNPDTISYLKSLPFNELQAHAEIKAFIDYKKKLQSLDGNGDTTTTEELEEVEYPQALTAALAALDEVMNEIASLAGDEFGSQCLETIARISAPYSPLAARKLLFGITGYMVHLSTHRYGSHVVQTILQFAIRPASQVGVSDEDISTYLELTEEEEEHNQDDGQDIPKMKDILYSISDELLSVTKDLAVHVCGSHVLRSLLCILGGVEETLPPHLVTKSSGLMESGGSRRGKIKGKKKKKKKRKEVDDRPSGGGAVNNASSTFFQLVDKPRFDTTDGDILDCLYSFIKELSGLDMRQTSSDDSEVSPPGELQQLACNPSAGPLLIVLLKVLTIKSSMRTESGTTKKILKDEKIGDFRLGIPHPENEYESGSQAEIFAKHLLSWDNKDQDGNEQKYAGDIIFGMSGECRGSHLLEVLLKSANDDFFAAICAAGNFFDSESIKEYAQHNVSNYVVQTVLHTVRTRTQAETMLKGLEDLISNGYILDSKNKRLGIFWRLVEMCAKFRVGQETVLKSMRKGFGRLGQSSDETQTSEKKNNGGAVEIKKCIPRLIRYQPPEKIGGRISLDVPGTRAVYHLLRFVPRLCGEVLDGIDTFTSEEIEELCKDGLGSRCVIDGILEGSVNFSRELLTKLKDRWVSLSVERVGHHIVRKVFVALKSMEDKMELSAELAKCINRLNGNSMGRSIIVDCAVKDFLEGEGVWREAVKRRTEKENFLNEIMEDKLGKPEKKRKRKRKKTTSNESEDDDSKKGRMDNGS